MVLAEEFNQEPTRQEPTVNQPINEVHHEPVQDNPPTKKETSRLAKRLRRLG